MKVILLNEEKRIDNRDHLGNLKNSKILKLYIDEKKESDKAVCLKIDGDDKYYKYFPKSQIKIQKIEKIFNDGRRRERTFLLIPDWMESNVDYVFEIRVSLYNKFMNGANIIDEKGNGFNPK